LPGRAGAGGFSVGVDDVDAAPVVLRRALQEGLEAIALVRSATSAGVKVGITRLGSAIVAIVKVCVLLVSCCDGGSF
jgi:hypothetical protein